MIFQDRGRPQGNISKKGQRQGQRQQGQRQGQRQKGQRQGQRQQGQQQGHRPSTLFIATTKETTYDRGTSSVVAANGRHLCSGYE